MRQPSDKAHARPSPFALAAIAAALTLAPAIAAPPAAPESHLPAAGLARALDAYNRATVSNDIRALAALVTDDYLLVNSDASVQDKASYLADFAVPGFKMEPYEVEHPFTRIHADAALTGGTFQLRWTQEGRRQSRQLRAAHFWVRQHGRWQIAYTQLTRVPE